MSWAEVVVLLLGAYAGIGIVFALVFVWKGVERIDPAAHNAGPGFRLLILPGCAAFWPLLLGRWRRV